METMRAKQHQVSEFSNLAWVNKKRRVLRNGASDHSNLDEGANIATPLLSVSLNETLSC